jgi:hypothetical protein
MGGKGPAGGDDVNRQDQAIDELFKYPYRTRQAGPRNSSIRRFIELAID